jgi:hypothetical protein
VINTVIPDKSFGVTADMSAAMSKLDALQRRLNAAAGQHVVIPYQGDIHGSAMGSRLPRFAGGGRFPGRPPADPNVDNLLGVDYAGIPRVMVRSREWVVNEQSSDYYGDRVMGAINGRRIPKEFLLGLPGLAGGGRVDGVPASANGAAGIAVNVRVEARTNADPAEIGAAAAQAVGSELRRQRRGGRYTGV